MNIFKEIKLMFKPVSVQPSEIAEIPKVEEKVRLKKECRNCIHMEQRSDGKAEWLECRRYPPEMFKSHDHRPFEFESEWPEVKKGDYCGEFWTLEDR